MSEEYLSICIPTRNRHETCLETIRAYVDSIVDGVKIVVVDNSDDEELSAGVYELFRDGLPDWLKFVPSNSEKIFSMRENWQRGLENCSGEWVCFIGDDDYVDPSVVELLVRLRSHKEKFDSLAWSHLNFHWPDMRVVPTTIKVNLSNKLTKYPVKAAYETIFNMATKRPLSGVSIYHGCLHRSLIDRVSQAVTHDGVFFKHSNTDYITGWMAAHFADNPGLTHRPISVAGASRKSNSAFVRQQGGARISVTRFKKELSDDVYLKSSSMVDTIVQLDTSPSTLTEYFFELSMDFIAIAKGARLGDKWKENLVNRANLELGELWDAEQFDYSVDSLRSFFLRLGIKNFKPVDFVPAPEAHNLARGFYEGHLYIPDGAFGSDTPYQLYKSVSNLLRPIDRIGKNIEVVKRG